MMDGALLLQPSHSLQGVDVDGLKATFAVRSLSLKGPNRRFADLPQLRDWRQRRVIDTKEDNGEVSRPADLVK